MEQFELIRRDREAGGASIRELARRHGVHRRAVRQALQAALPPERARPEHRPAPALGAYHALIDAWLTADRTAPRKQRHTARRIFERLCEGQALGVTPLGGTRPPRTRFRYREEQRDETMVNLSGLSETQREAALALLTGICCARWVRDGRHSPSKPSMERALLNLGRAAMRAVGILPDGLLRDRARTEVARAARLLGKASDDSESARILAAFALGNAHGSLSAEDRAALEALADPSAAALGARGGRSLFRRREPAPSDPPRSVPTPDALGEPDFDAFRIGVVVISDGEEEPLLSVFRTMGDVLSGAQDEPAFRAVLELNHDVLYGHMIHSDYGTLYGFWAPERLLDPDGLADAAVWVADNADEAEEQLRRARGLS